MPPTAVSAATIRRARKVRFLLLDVDGVLTDGRLHYSSEGVESKAFHARDGLGIRLARDAGIEVGLLSGRTSKAVEARARELGIQEVILGALPKLPRFEDLLQRRGLAADEVCYVGDDIVDVPILKRTGLPASVADAHPEAIRAALWVTRASGGAGAVREIVDQLIRVHGRWDAVVHPYMH